MINSVALFFIFIISFVAISVICFMILKCAIPGFWENHLTHESVGISSSIMDSLAILVSIPLSFILVYLWQAYNDLLNTINTTVKRLRLLYDKSVIANIDTNDFVKYIKTKNVKYFNKFKHYVYNSDNSSNKALIKLIDNTNVELDFKHQVSQEIWYVIVVGVISVIIGTWLVKSPFWLHLYLIVSVAAILGTLVFLIYFYDNMLVDCEGARDDAFDALYEKIHHVH